MHPATAFARRWWLAARFPIGANDWAGIAQIALPAGPVPNTGDDDLDYALGFELGQALLKLRRPWPPLPGQDVEIDDAPDYLSDLSRRIGQGPAVEWLRLGFLAAVDTLVDVALNAPDRMPAILARVDRLNDQATRARIAYLLESREPLPSVFDDAFDALPMATPGPNAKG